MSTKSGQVFRSGSWSSRLCPTLPVGQDAVGAPGMQPVATQRGHRGRDGRARAGAIQDHYLPPPIALAALASQLVPPRLHRRAAACLRLGIGGRLPAQR